MSSYSITILAFAQARDLLGFSEKTYEVTPHQTAAEILHQIHPQFLTKNRTFRIAWDESYADAHEPAHHRKTLAIIPPVSGG